MGENREQMMDFYIKTYPVVQRSDLEWVAEKVQGVRALAFTGHSKDRGPFRATNVVRCESEEQVREAVRECDFDSAMIVRRGDVNPPPNL